MTTNNEFYIDITGYGGKYLISNLGNVISANYRRTNIRKNLVKSKDKDGYECVTLSNKGVLKNIKVHRLVAIHFVDNPFNYTEINHKDGVKSNNIFSNLEWSSRTENIIHSYNAGLKPKTTPRHQAAVRLSNSKRKGTKYKNNSI